MGFIIETSIIKLYEGETLWVEIVKYLEKLGYKVWSIERGFSNKKTNQVFQLDIIFIHQDYIKK